MDGFCLQGELDLTLFYKIEGYFDNLKSLMTENDRDLNDRTLWGVENDNDRKWPWPEKTGIPGRTKIGRSPHIEVSGRFHLWLSLFIIIRQTPCPLSHAARYSERSSDSGQNADGYLKNCFPSVRFHFFWMLNGFWMLNVECWMLNFCGRTVWARG